jgi:DNA-binding response OmpR family regulator
VGPVAFVEAGLHLVQQEAVDLALLNVFLGSGGDGVEMAACLHHDHAIPSLFVSGNPARARNASTVALGVLHKPCCPDEVVSAVAVVPVLLTGKTPEVVPPALELFPRRERRKP